MSSSTNAVAVIVPSDIEPNCTVPEAVTLVAPVIAPDAILAVPSVSVLPVIVAPLKFPEPSLFTSLLAVLALVAPSIISVSYTHLRAHET